MSDPPPVALTIAGSDCCAGAGLQADLKAFSAFGVYGLTAVSAVVTETPLAVHGILPVEPAALQQQVRILLETYPVKAVKTGMLASLPQIVAVAEILAESGLPLVVDPVLVASTGDVLQESGAIPIYVDRLLPHASLLTPNLPEALTLLGERPGAEISPLELLDDLAARLPCPVLLTGGHCEADDGDVIDWLHDGSTRTPFPGPRVGGDQTHGTGCTLSAAITAGLAHGRSLPNSIADAKRYVTRALQTAHAWTDGEDELRALNQLPARPFPADQT